MIQFLMMAIAQEGVAADPGNMVKDIIDLANGGAMGAAIGTGLMLLIVLASKFKLTNFLPEGSKKWLALGLSIAGAVGAGLIAGSGAADIIGAAVSAAASAVGSYEFFGRALAEKLGADA